MRKQTGLFDDPEQERSNYSGILETESRVIRALTLLTAGATTEEISWLLQCDVESVKPLMATLRENGKIVDSGERRDNGRAIIWKIRKGKS